MELQPHSEFHHSEPEHEEEVLSVQEELIPIDNEMYVRAVGLKGELPDGFGEKILDLRTRYLRESPAIKRLEKYKNKIKQVRMEHEWFRGIYNNKNNTRTQITYTHQRNTSNSKN